MNLLFYDDIQKARKALLKRYYYLGIFLLLCLLGCASLEDHSNYSLLYRQSLAKGDCETAQSRIPLEKDDTKFVRFYQGAIGYVAYTSTIPFTVGLDLLLIGRCQYGCPMEQKKPFLEMLFPTSAYTYEYTKDMRCPDTGYYMQKFLEVTECYERRNDKKSLQLAHDQLKFVEDSFDSGPSCMKVRDYQIVKSSRKRMEQKLQQDPTKYL